MAYWHALHKKWKLMGIGPALAIWLQCRWREKVAIRKCEAIRRRRIDEERAALRLQCTWMTHKNAFHTYLLMCAYRSIKEIEKLAEYAARKLGRNVTARMIERYYKRRHYHRMQSNANKIQAWYRGTKGYNMVMLMRLTRWATRAFIRRAPQKLCPREAMCAPSHTQSRTGFLGNRRSEAAASRANSRV